MTVEDMEHMAIKLSQEERINTIELCALKNPEIGPSLHDFTVKRFNEDKKRVEELSQAAGSGKIAFYYGSAHGSTLASGMPGKVEGIVGVPPYPGVSFADKSEFIRSITPFFRYHYDVDTGVTSEASSGIKGFFQRLSLPQIFPSFSPN
jgi:hypothetical protein